MILLALDTCLASCSVAVFDGDSQRVIAAQCELMDRGQAEALAPMVQNVLANAGLGMDAITAIAATTGPGTFTGVRIGLAMAQGLALPRALPIIGISTMQATAAAVVGQNRHIAVCHAAGATGQCYVQHFSSDGLAHGDVSLQSPEALRVAADSILIGTGAAMIAHPALRKPEHDLPDAKFFAAFASGLAGRHHAEIQPLYGRGVDAKPMVSRIDVGRVGVDAANILSGLHSKSFEDGWSVEAIESMLQTPGTLALLAHRDRQPVGFIMQRAIAGEAEILTLAVHPRHRRRGVAMQLMTSGRTYLASLQTTALFLEVAADNTAALTLYERQGFERAGVRRGYYQRGTSPAVDALIMRRPI